MCCLRSDEAEPWFLSFAGMLFAMALLTKVQYRCENNKCAPGLCIFHGLREDLRSLC